MMPKSTESKMCLKAIVDIDCASGEAGKAVLDGRYPERCGFYVYRYASGYRRCPSYSISIYRC